MEQSIETTPLNLVRQVLSGTGSRKQNIFRRRRRKHSDDESSLDEMKQIHESGHIDLRC